tara:strand:+ start:352 stop:1005 length:654 start_codon:yes stop_codon:yes gene_type:complete
MIEAIQFGIALAGFLITWNVMVKKTVLDARRDQLFELRDDVRSYFVERAISLDSKEYKQLRDLINGYLRYTEDLSFSAFIAFGGKLSASPKLEKHLASKLNSAFKTKDTELDEFIKNSRRRASEVASNYVVEKSGIAMFLVVFALVFVVLPYTVVIKPIINSLKSTMNSFPAADEVVGDFRLSKYRSARNKLVGKIVDAEELEEGAFLFGKNHLRYA